MCYRVVLPEEMNWKFRSLQRQFFLEYMIVIQILRPKSVLVYEKMVYFGSKIYLNITIVVKQCCEFVIVKNTAAMERFQSIR